MAEQLTFVLDASGDVVRVAVGSPADVALAPGEVALAQADAPAGAWIGWKRKADGSFVDPRAAVSLPLTKADLVAYAAARRFEIETGGITVAGAPIKTDRESQNLINGARDLAKEEPDEPIEFKTGPGTFFVVDAPTMLTIALKVGQHVRGSFARERQACLAIDAGTATSTADVDRILAGG